MGTNSDQDPISELEWIQLRKDLDELGSNETFTGRLISKCSESPLVPIGTVSTVACLLLGLYNFNKGNSKNQQLFMKGRVFAQGFTVVALVTGMLYSVKKTGN